MEHPFRYINLFGDNPICKYLQSIFSLALWDVNQTKKHKKLCPNSSILLTWKKKKLRLIILILGIRYELYEILEKLSWFKWSVKQSLNVIPYLNIIFMVICFFGYLDICLHQCSIMHFFFIYPALFLYFCISCQKNMT